MHHITQHARSHLAGHTFMGHARPRKINRSLPYLGTTERPARRSKSYGAGVWAHRPLHTCMLRTRPEADLAPLIQARAYGPMRRAPLSRCRQKELRLIPRRRLPISCPTWRLVRIRSTTQLRSNIKISLSVLSIRERRTWPGPPLS